MLGAVSANAMSYQEAKEQAWFLTDKMAYELNLTSDQYDRAYQINLDYLMSVNTASDCTGYYWQYRDADLRCILFDWQYNLYRTLDYFFRPVRWYQSRWYYPVFDHYRYGYYYFNRPNVYVSYTGGMWRNRGHNTPSPYVAMRPERGLGMRDQYQNHNFGYGGGYGNRGHNDDRGHGNNFGGNPGNQGQGFHQGNGGNGGNNGFRPDVNNRGGVNQASNGRSNTSTTSPYRDSYTNYRQTGNSTTQSGRGFAGGQVSRSGAYGASSSSSSTNQGGRSSYSGSTSTTQNGRGFGGAGTSTRSTSSQSGSSTDRGHGRSFGGR